MAKKLIICCDGTWQEPENNLAGNTIPTNVLKITRAIQPENSVDKSPQIVFYDAGVGTGNRLDKFLGGAFGVGLSANILQAYRFLATNYAPGDEIFCFGFSRGAYSVRSLSGLIDTIGLLPKSELGKLAKAYHYYRTPPLKRNRDKFLDVLELIDQVRNAERMVRINFLGVWDTVGALGIPTPLLGPISKKLWVGFHDTKLSGNVDYAYQAVAIDERRGPYKPDLWTAGGNAKEIMQVWFTGSHSDIGGGNVDTGLSDQALTWMIDLAQIHGLSFDQNYIRNTVKPNQYGRLTDSFSKPYQWAEKMGYHAFMRRMGERIYGVSGNERPINEFVHLSVLERWNDDASNYRPRNLSKQTLVEMPVYQPVVPVLSQDEQERRSTRREKLINVDGTLRINDQHGTCQILDFASGSGLRIKAGNGAQLVEGSDIAIASNYTGEINGTIVWNRNSEAGIKLRQMM